MIAFLGTGLLGSNWVRNLRKQGEDVHVWNRTYSRAKPLEETGAKVFENVAEAVKGAERIHICVSDDVAVDSILEQASSGVSKDVIIIDHTTTTATGAKKRVAEWKAKGVTFIHAPVFMGPGNALESSGIMLISGDQNVVKKIEPELQKITGELRNLGDNPGKAAAYKLLGNHLFLAITAGLADSFTLGKALGLTGQDVIDYIEHMATAPLKARVARLLMGNYNEPTWELLMARKDARLMVEETERAGKKLDVMPVFGAHMDELIAQGLGGKDWTIVTKEAVS